MITSNIPNLSSMSMVKAKVDFFNGSTLVQTCTCGDFLEDFEITREGDNSKFFGFGICHKLDMNLIDLNRQLQVTKDNTVEIGLGDGTIWDAPYPTFYITELKRDEKTNTITATAYDKLFWAGEYLFADLGLKAPYTLRQVAQAVATKLGLSLSIPTSLSSAFNLNYEDEANLDGTESLRSILNWIAEVTQAIYYVNQNNLLVFKRLNKNGEAVEEITKDDYYELNTKTPRTLTIICHTTELGDNVETSLGEEGAIQYIRNNPFLELRTDLATILDNARDVIGGITITQFDCDWSGNYLLEIGDKIALTTEDGGIVYSYLLSDTVTFAGTFNEASSWEYTDQQPETYANPTNIGERINQTFAKVDKVNKQITLQASEIAETKESIGALRVSTTEISASVSSVEKKVTDVEDKLEDSKDVTNERINSLAQDVSLKLDKQGVEIAVESILTEGVEKVVTASKKYTFDDTGLNVSSSDSEISTVVTEDGMRIYRHSTEVLTVDNTGVQAADLHARTFLIIGENSRLEDRGSRTACFWIGPAGG
jgi:hypothetical protein